MKTYNEKLGQYLAIGESRVYRWVLKNVRDVEIAEEICQDACEGVLRIIKQRGELPETDVYRLMFHIARCKIINYQKKSSTKLEDLLDYVEMARFPLTERYNPEDDEMRAVLYEHIELLKDVERTVVMGKINDWTAQELSEYLHRSPHAIACIYSRAVKKLKKMINPKLI